MNVTRCHSCLREFDADRGSERDHSGRVYCSVPCKESFLANPPTHPDWKVGALVHVPELARPSQPSQLTRCKYCVRGFYQGFNDRAPRPCERCGGTGNG